MAILVKRRDTSAATMVLTTRRNAAAISKEKNHGTINNGCKFRILVSLIPISFKMPSVLMFSVVQSQKRVQKHTSEDRDAKVALRRKAQRYPRRCTAVVSNEVEMLASLGEVKLSIHNQRPTFCSPWQDDGVWRLQSRTVRASTPRPRARRAFRGLWRNFRPKDRRIENLRRQDEPTIHCCNELWTMTRWSYQPWKNFIS